MLGLGLQCANTEGFMRRWRGADPEADTWQTGALWVGSGGVITRRDGDFVDLLCLEGSQADMALPALGCLGSGAGREAVCHVPQLLSPPLCHQGYNYGLEKKKEGRKISLKVGML